MLPFYPCSSVTIIFLFSAKDWFAICELSTSTFCELAMNEPFTVQLFIVENPDLVPGHVPVWNLAPIYFA